jgi:hypothetical protein
MKETFKALGQIAEQKISQAMQEGQFDNLPGKGKPLELEDLSNVPPELRMAYTILKNSGYTSPEIEDRKEIANIRDMLQDCHEESARYRQIQKLNFLVTKINEQRRSPVYLELEQTYYQQVVERVSVNDLKKQGQDS